MLLSKFHFENYIECRSLNSFFGLISYLDLISLHCLQYLVSKYHVIYIIIFLTIFSFLLLLVMACGRTCNLVNVLEFVSISP